MPAFPPRHSVTLVRHPAAPESAARGIEARVGWTDGGALAFTYRVKGDLNRLRIPPWRAPERTDRLWEHTCFEAFVAVKDRPAYTEFNFAPSGEWAVHAFSSYRASAALARDGSAPQITARSAGDVFELHALIDARLLPALSARDRIKLALAAVIEDDGGMLSYWALKHPPGTPDFHHADGFALELEYHAMTLRMDTERK